MAYVLRALIPVVWIAWLLYWILAARATNETERRENFRSRMTHYAPLILGGVFLGVPNVLGPMMDGEFHAQTLAWLWPTVGLIVVGLGFATWARIWLGRNWSAEVTVKRDHELIRSGPYAVVRHPIYTGLLLALVGTALSISKWRALVGLVFISAALLRRVTIEERFMTVQFGDAYRRYRADVPALIPFLTP